ncbi:hypothetical protein, partial [Vibrio vulnificus]|uniref:hypothetical protein n=1 Tax=Vibrio vulnificus TaxID=672 RepID=UPI0024DF7F91
MDEDRSAIRKKKKPLSSLTLTITTQNTNHYTSTNHQSMLITHTPILLLSIKATTKQSPMPTT